MGDIILDEAKVGAQYKIVVPKAVRRIMELEQEDYVRFILHDGVIRIEKHKE